MFRISLCFVVWLCGSAIAEAAPLTFRFHPPDSISFTEEVKTDHTRWSDSSAFPTDSSIAVYARTIKLTKSGYRMSVQATSIVTKRGDQIADNPVNAILLGTRVTTKLDTLGLITEVTGFERLPKQIDSLYTGELAMRLKRSLSPENMSAREKFQWNGILENLAGATIDLDSIDYEQSEYPLPGGGHLPLLIAVRVSDTVTLEGKLCAILLISAGSDISELAGRLHLPADELAIHYPFADTLGVAVAKGGSRYIADTRAVLEIATLLPLSERTQRDVTVYGTTDAGSKKLRLVQGETRRFVYHR